jgi:hypothetical protein
MDLFSGSRSYVFAFDLNHDAGNSQPATGYIGAYVFASVMLTVAGCVILLL